MIDAEVKLTSCLTVGDHLYLQPNHDRQPVMEMKEAEESGEFTYVPGQKNAAEDAEEEGPNSPPPSPASVSCHPHSQWFLVLFANNIEGAMLVRHLILQSCVTGCCL